ncbi:MAG TPA: ATP-binding protein [Myxococcus sp.]|nr:ATP-binding protein [Myxococcus sp.]
MRHEGPPPGLAGWAVGYTTSAGGRVDGERAPAGRRYDGLRHDLFLVEVLSIGLGLFIVDQSVRAHGGHVDVRSREEEGTVFHVHLPRRALSAVEVG